MLDLNTSNGGLKYILNIIVCAINFALYYACLSQSDNEVYMQSVSLFLSGFISKKLHSDNGLEFRNNKISSLLKSFNIRKVFGESRNL